MSSGSRTSASGPGGGHTGRPTGLWTLLFQDSNVCCSTCLRKRPTTRTGQIQSSCKHESGSVTFTSLSTDSGAPSCPARTTRVSPGLRAGEAAGGGTWSPRGRATPLACDELFGPGRKFESFLVEASCPRGEGRSCPEKRPALTERSRASATVRRPERLLHHTADRQAHHRPAG